MSRFHALGFVAALATGCAPVVKVLPQGPAVAGAALEPFQGVPAPSGVRYTDDPRVPFPVLPVQVWGVHYVRDLVLVSRHPHWTMHEYALIRFPGQEAWMVKDADREGTQHVVADLDDLASWLPEIPVDRTRAAVEVEDRSTDRVLDITLRTRNSEGDDVFLEFRGRQPRGAPARRNGSTMDHSRGAVAAVLDLAGQTHGGRTRLHIGGRRWGIRHLLGLYKMQFVLDQYQAGFAVASFVQAALPEGFDLTRPAPGVDWPTRGEERWTDDGATVARVGSAVTLVYDFPDRGGVREWTGARVLQEGEAEPVLVVRLDRALPDLRRPFEGRAESRFVLDINGQLAHGTGTLAAWWDDAGPVVELRPTAPWWLAERPMRTRVTFDAEAATTRITRIPVEAP